MSGHPFLQPLNPSPGELLSDADPIASGVIEMGDGSLHHYVAPGTVSHQLGYDHVPLTTARSEGTAATHNQQTWGSRGAGNIPGPHNRPGI